MVSGKSLHIYIPKHLFTSGDSLYGLVARKQKRWNAPFIHSVGIRTSFHDSCTAAERFVFRRIFLSHGSLNARMIPSYK